MSGRAATMHRVLFIRTDRLGETLLNLPAVAALKASLPQGTVTMLVQPELAPLLRAVPMVDDVLTWSGGTEDLWWWRALWLGGRLRRGGYQAAIISNPKRELHAAVWLAGIPRRVGYDRKWGDLLTHRLPDRKALGDRHEVDYNLDLIEALGLPRAVPLWRWPAFEPEWATVHPLLAAQGLAPDRPLLLVHPWTSNPIKQWPLARFRRLMQLAVERRPLQVVVVGGPEARARVSEVWPGPGPVADLVGRIDLRQLAALLQRARLLVSNDSGPVHLAASLGTPTVVLFGTRGLAAGPRRWGPWGEGHSVISNSSLDAIGVEDVWDVVQAKLG